MDGARYVRFQLVFKAHRLLYRCLSSGDAVWMVQDVQTNRPPVVLFGVMVYIYIYMYIYII